MTTLFLSVFVVAGVFGFLGGRRRKEGEPDSGTGSERVDDLQQRMFPLAGDAQEPAASEIAPTAVEELPAEALPGGAPVVNETVEAVPQLDPVAVLQQEVESLRQHGKEQTARIEELEAEVRRYRRWANTQVKRLVSRLSEAWPEAGLPTRVVNMKQPPTAETPAGVREVADALHQWTRDLGLSETDVFYWIGLWHALEGRLEDAVGMLQKAVHLGKGVDGWLALGDTQWLLDRRKKACDIYRRCRDEKKAPAHIYYRCALVAADERRYADALVEIEHCLKRKKPDEETYRLASLVCAKLGDNERAVALCEEGLSKHPDSALLLADMIIPLAQGGQRQRADEIYARLRETAPTLAEVPFSMGVVHMHAEELDTAVKLFEEALSLRADFPEAYFCLGVIQNRKGEYQNALSYFKLAVELKPDYAEAYYNMKDSYDGLRDFESSIAMLDKAVHLNPAYR